MRIVISFPISFENRNADTKKALNINSTSNFLHYVCYEYPASDPSLFRIAAGAGALFLSNGGKIEEGDCGEPYDSLQYDFNRDWCLQAEGRIRAMVWYLRKSRSGVAPAFLRLVFRDCSIEGCDSSVLLDEADGVDSEKMSLPSESLNRFYVINIIKEDLEEIFPGVVSYSDTLALAAREGVVLAGGPFYPLHTGRRDSRLALADIATFELPLPNADLPETLASFASRGFDLRETVTFLDAHGIGVIHCIFFKSHLCNFGRINESLDPGFLNLLRSKCRNVHSGSAVLAGPFNPLYIGSRDSMHMLTFAVIATNADLSTFELREMSSLCRQALKAVVVIAIIYYALGSQPQQIYMGQNGVPAGDQGRKRKTEPTLRELQQQLHTQKRQRITHPRSRRFIGGMDQPVLFELKITCEMMQFVLTLSPEDSLDYGTFTYDMTGYCRFCGFSLHVPLNFDTRREINSTCRGCGCYCYVELQGIGDPLTAEQVRNHNWATILQFWSCNLRRFRINFVETYWAVRGVHRQEYIILLDYHNRYFHRYPRRFDSDLYRFRYEAGGGLVCKVVGLKARIREVRRQLIQLDLIELPVSNVAAAAA
ncbi:putative peroxidase 48 [Citrus sinensis]|uniref:uncharacterized protein LOC18036942 n=2 Tax=Citrus TaxID=2706 RepID=UPI000CED3526|nr:uncharacterized protein LOC18036942 [Citrus x clementina]KAH9666730.1 putative peroxidase 48 [Citrus sinensis]